MAAMLPKHESVSNTEPISFAKHYNYNNTQAGSYILERENCHLVYLVFIEYLKYQMK